MATLVTTVNRIGKNDVSPARYTESMANLFPHQEPAKRFAKSAPKSRKAVEAIRYVHRLGKLPTALRKGVSRLVVHHGGQDTTAFSDQGLIVVYAGNVTKRIETHDLEETIFHESVHAAWDRNHAKSDRWKRDQLADNAFATVYAQSQPELEDLAESALFAYTLLHHSDRIPAEDAAKIKKAIPNRILYVAELLPPEKPIFYRINESIPALWDADTDEVRCDIRKPGVLADILSNSLLIDFEINVKDVKKITSGAQDRYDTSEELFQAAIVKLELDPSTLKEALIRNLHCNCQHKPEADDRLARDLIASWKGGQ